MARLPQELIDEILSNLPTDNKQFLRSCSLVSRSTVRASQKLLFESVETRPGNLLSWLDGTPRVNAELLEDVRRLTCCKEELYRGQSTSLEYGRRRDHLGSLTKLRDFTLRDTNLDSPSQIWLFSALPSTLSTLSLLGCGVSTSALATLLNCFSKLECLCLEGVTHLDSSEETRLPSRKTLLKKLHINGRPEGFLSLLEELSELGLYFDEVASGPTQAWEAVANCVVRSFGASLKHLRLPQVPYDIYVSPGKLSICRELEEFELEIPACPLSNSELNLISSITSMNIKKIIIRRAAFGHPVGLASWASLDEALFQLVERLGDSHRLEIELRVKRGVIRGARGQDKPKLPKFVNAEKSRVKVWDHRDQEVYCSDEPGEGSNPHG